MDTRRFFYSKGPGLALPFNNETNILIDRFISLAVGKIHKLGNERLHELEAPWVVN